MENGKKKKFMGKELHKKTVAIAGLGAIGRLVARRLSGFECNILGYDPLVSAEKAKELGIKLVHNLNDLVSQSDIITLHIPETAATRGMINEELLSIMKEGCCIINAARAGIIDEDALRKVKKQKEIHLCTDVYPKDAAGMKPVADIADLMLPHLGANTYEANRNAAQRAADQLVDYNMGVTKFIVNRNIPDGLDENYQKLTYYLSKVCAAFGVAENLHPETIKSSFYGDLQQYSEYLTAPIVMGLGVKSFDSSYSKDDAINYLKDRGIMLKNSCKIDNSKGYGDSVTVEMVYGQRSSATRMSVRGQIIDDIPMISRMDQFSGLYFDVRGHNTFVKYYDQPGMLAKLSNIIARHEVNIEDIRCPHHPHSGCSLAVLRTNIAIGESCLNQLKTSHGVIKAGTLSCL